MAHTDLSHALLQVSVDELSRRMLLLCSADLTWGWSHGECDFEIWLLLTKLYFLYSSCLTWGREGVQLPPNWVWAAHHENMETEAKKEHKAASPRKMQMFYSGCRHSQGTELLCCPAHSLAVLEEIAAEWWGDVGTKHWGMTPKGFHQ